MAKTWSIEEQREAAKLAMTLSMAVTVFTGPYVRHSRNMRLTHTIVGAALGAAVTVLLTNESVQKGIVTAVARMTAAAPSGIEEMKEKLRTPRQKSLPRPGSSNFSR